MYEKNPTRIGKTENQSFKTDRRSVFGLLKTDRFWVWSRFPSRLYQNVLLMTRVENRNTLT
jgi:hypothetical protein